MLCACRVLPLTQSLGYLVGAHAAHPAASSFCIWRFLEVVPASRKGCRRPDEAERQAAQSGVHKIERRSPVSLPILRITRETIADRMRSTFDAQQHNMAAVNKTLF